MVGVRQEAGEGFHVALVDALLVRRVEPRNTPTVINAAFNFRNFWDGRANNVFNGVDPFGRRSTGARVLEVQADGSVAKVAVDLRNSSLASQAVGPALSPFEMSCAGRTFPHLGRKLLRLRPLGQQRVSPEDSVLGALSRAPQPGLSTTYAALIQRAFHSRLWDSERVFDGAQDEVASPTPGAAGEFSLMESNFSLFWGLAIQLYEATLVSDDTPFDCGAVTTALVNAAWSRGLGAVINSQGIMQSPVVREHAGIAEDQVIMKSIALGWPDETFPANAVVSERKRVDEATVFVGFD